MNRFELNNLFILDLANNHQGDLNHGLNIIAAVGKVVRETGVRAAIKFQFRQLDTFIHPEYIDRKDIKHIPRFVETRLDLDSYKQLMSKSTAEGLFTMCTPFDEESVTIIQQMKFNAIKVASCSVTDRPLLEAVAKANMPVVVSTGGATMSEIEFVVHLLRRNGVIFALEHCVSIYPTPADKLQLNQIEYLKNHFKGIPVGWSTHEDPDDFTTVQLAVAKGATLFERHIGMTTNTYSLNAYSSTPEQVHNWILAYKSALICCGSINRAPPSMEESNALNSLMRGVFVNKDIPAGRSIVGEDVFFAMPAVAGCLLSGQWRGSTVADRDYLSGEPLDKGLANLELSQEENIAQVMLQIQGMLQDARIQLNENSKIEISHHYGLKRLREFGAIIIDVINREYCKKLIVLLPRQKHPYHYHKKKEETFQVLHGEMEVEKDGNPTHLKAGDLFLVEQGHWHKFSTLDGVIFEEISTTHHDDDSFYEDARINNMPRELRKTVVENW